MEEKHQKAILKLSLWHIDEQGFSLDSGSFDVWTQPCQSDTYWVTQHLEVGAPSPGWKHFSALCIFSTRFSLQHCNIHLSSPFTALNVRAPARWIGSHPLRVVNRKPQEESYQHNRNTFSAYVIFWEHNLALSVLLKGDNCIFPRCV